MNVTIIYESDGGCTRKIAKSIAAKTSGKAIDISDAEPTDMENCSLLIPMPMASCRTTGKPISASSNGRSSPINAWRFSEPATR